MSTKNYGAPPPTAPAYPVQSTVAVGEPVRQRRTTTGAPAASKTTSHPPPGAPDGGTWGSVKYAGDQTNLMCLVLCLLGGIFTGCGTCAYLCPMDKKDGYRVGRSVSSALMGSAHSFALTKIRTANKMDFLLLTTQVYDARGKLLGNVGSVDWIMNPHWRPSVIKSATEPTTGPPTKSVKKTTVINADGSKTVTIEEVEG